MAVKFVRDDDGMFMPAFCINDNPWVRIGDKVVVKDRLASDFPGLFTADKEYEVVGFDNKEPVVVCDTGTKMYIGRFEIKRLNGKEA